MPLVFKIITSLIHHTECIIVTYFHIENSACPHQQEKRGKKERKKGGGQMMEGHSCLILLCPSTAGQFIKKLFCRVFLPNLVSFRKGAPSLGAHA